MDPIEARNKKIKARTKKEMAVGKQAAKRSAAARKKWMREYAKRTADAPVASTADAPVASTADAPVASTADAPVASTNQYIHPSIVLPEAVQRQAAIANSFYEEGRFEALIQQVDNLVKTIEFKGPSFRVATPGERAAMLKATARFIQMVGEHIHKT